MKKVLLGLVIIFTLSVATCFAAPLNTLKPGQTAMGLVYWGASDPNYVTITYDDWNMGGVYLEHKFSDKLTIGFESIGRSDYDIDDPDFVTVNSYLTDIYLQYHINNNHRLLLGNKFFNQDMQDIYGTSYGYYTDSKPYVGVAFTSKLSDSMEGYAALTTADIQVGANLNFSKNFSGNIFYRTCSVENLDLSGIGFGLSLKFNTNHKVIIIKEDTDKKGSPKEKDKDKKDSPKEKDKDKKDSPKEKDKDEKDSPKDKDKDKKDSPKEKDKDEKDSLKEKDKDKKDSPKEKDKDEKDSPKEKDKDKKDSPKEKDKDKKDSPKEEDRDKKDSPKEEDRDKKDSPKEKDRGKKVILEEEDGDKKDSPKEKDGEAA
jgi:hypothetical protein